jgi:hypothetical protein
MSSAVRSISPQAGHVALIVVIFEPLHMEVPFLCKGYRPRERVV